MAACAVGTIKYEDGLLPQHFPYPPASVKEPEYSGKAVKYGLLEVRWLY
jgi:hypothetical protein